MSFYASNSIVKAVGATQGAATAWLSPVCPSDNDSQPIVASDVFGDTLASGLLPLAANDDVMISVKAIDNARNISSASVDADEIVPCFTPGNMIATPRGEVPVEHLKVGDRVITRDNGIQEIRWIGGKTYGWLDLAARPQLRPVMIRAGSLGNGLPERDTLVSPDHRVLLANDRTAHYFDEHEVLASAKDLVSGTKIGQAQITDVTYIHFMCDRHEVVLSNGAWSESFQPCGKALRGIGVVQRNEILALLPELKTGEVVERYQAARRVLKWSETFLLAGSIG